MPAVKVRAKYFVEAGPKKYKTSKARITVSDVLIERVKVCLMLFPTVSAKLPLVCAFKFSLIRSKTTMVSFTERPMMVRRPTTKRVSTSAPAYLPKIAPFLRRPY